MVIQSGMAIKVCSCFTLSIFSFHQIAPFFVLAGLAIATITVGHQRSVYAGAKRVQAFSVARFSRVPLNFSPKAAYLARFIRYRINNDEWRAMMKACATCNFKVSSEDRKMY